METRSKKICKTFRVPTLLKRNAQRSQQKSLTIDSETPAADLEIPHVPPAIDSFEDFFDDTQPEPISQLSLANEMITSVQSATSQILINEKKMNKADVDFTKPEWDKVPWNSGHTNAIVFDQVRHENVVTNLVICKLCPLIVEKRHGKTLRIHRAVHFGQEILEPLAQEIRERALNVIATDGRPFSMFSTEAMKSYSAICAKIGAAYARAGIEINPNTIVPSRYSLSRTTTNLHEKMLNSTEWQEFITKLRQRGAFTVDLGMKRRHQFMVVTGSLVKDDFSGLQTSVISVIPLPVTMDHTTSNIRRILRDELQHFGFTDEDFTKIFLTTDEGSNVVVNQHRCACHVGNTIIKRSTRPYKISRGQEDVYGSQVRTTLDTMSQTLRNLEKFILSAKRNSKIDESVGQFLKTLVPTRWYSELDLAESFINNIDAITLAMENHGDAQLCMNFALVAQSNNYVRSYVDVLKPFRDFISDFEMSKQPMLDKLLFRLKYLGSHLHKIMDTNENATMKWNVAFAANCALSRKLKALNMIPMLISAFLNPTICKRLDRICSFLNEKYQLNLSTDMAKNELIQFAARQGIRTVHTPTEHSLYDEEDDNFKIEENESSSLELEIASYLSEKNAILTVPEKFDVLQYWAHSKGILPQMVELAKIQHARQASSADSERTTSTISWLREDPSRDQTDVMSTANIIIYRSFKQN